MAFECLYKVYLSAYAKQESKFDLEKLSDMEHAALALGTQDRETINVVKTEDKFFISLKEYRSEPTSNRIEKLIDEIESLKNEVQRQKNINRALREQWPIAK